MNIEDIANNLIDKLGQRKHIAKKQTVYVMPGVGRKQCDKCNQYVGVRTRVCVCGHEFKKGSNRKLTAPEQLANENEISEETKRYAASIRASGRLIYVPAGPCPAKLSSLDQEDVFQFCNDIVGIGRVDKKVYTVEAIKKWVQHMFEYNSEEYKTTCALVDLWYDDMIGVDKTSDINN